MRVTRLANAKVHGRETLASEFYGNPGTAGKIRTQTTSLGARIKREKGKKPKVPTFLLRKADVNPPPKVLLS